MIERPTDPATTDPDGRVDPRTTVNPTKADDG
jgi:hypothetical protein